MSSTRVFPSLLAAARRRRSWGWPANLAAFLVGASAMPVSLGLAIQRIDKTGLGLGTAGSVLLFVAALSLLVASGIGMTRRVGRWSRVPLLLGLVGFVFLTTWVVGQAVAVTNVPRTQVGATTPTHLGFSYEDVTFEAPDGVTLSGWYIPSSNRAALILLHGSGSTRSAVLDHAALMAGHGYGVLLFDARGHGRSDGEAMDLGWHGDADIAGAVSFLGARPEVDPGSIAAIGMSMGGEEAIGALASDERLVAVVAEGATSRVTGDNAWLSDRYGWRGDLQRGVDWLFYNFADLLTEAEQPITLRRAVQEAAPRRVLLIAAGQVPSEEESGRYIMAGSPDTVELWVLPEAGHTGGLSRYPDDWEARVTEFLEEALAGS